MKLEQYLSNILASVMFYEVNDITRRILNLRFNDEKSNFEIFQIIKSEFIDWDVHVPEASSVEQVIQNALRNRRIMELKLGFDGRGARTAKVVHEIVTAEFPEQSVTQERIRQVTVKGLEALTFEVKRLGWTGIPEKIERFIESQVPIEYTVLENKLVDPNYDYMSDEEPIPSKRGLTENVFQASGLIELLSLRPDNLPPINFNPKQRIYPNALEDVEVTGRNIHYSRYFFVPLKFGSSLPTLLAHAVRGVRSNGIVKEQKLAYLMPKSLTVSKREELAHSLVKCKRDFMWIDQHLGWFTFTELADNRITSIVRKIFGAADKVTLDELTAAVGRAVKLPTRAASTDGKKKQFIPRANYLVKEGFGPNVAFTKEIAKLYLGQLFVHIDENEVVTPAKSLLQLPPVELKFAERIMLDVLMQEGSHPVEVSKFRELSMERMSQVASQGYLARLDEYVESCFISMIDGKHVLPAASLDLFESKKRENIKLKVDELEAERSAYNAERAMIITACKAEYSLFTGQIRNIKKQLKQMVASGGPSEDIDQIRVDIEELFLNKAASVVPDERFESLKNECIRIEKVLSKQIQKKQDQPTIEATKIRLAKANEMLASVDQNEDTLKILELKGMIAAVDDKILALPKVNDKYDEAIVSLFIDTGIKEGDYLTINSNEVRERLLDYALEQELKHAKAHFIMNLSYSPAFKLVKRGFYSYTGSELA